MNANLLHVVTAIFNPLQWESRIRLYNQFEQQMLDSGVNLTTIECELGNRPFKLSNPHVNHVKVRSQTLLWNKENLLNLAIASVSAKFPNWQYLCWSDADIVFRLPNWPVETVHALQQYYIIQPWAKALDLGPGGQILHTWDSFCKQVSIEAPMKASADPYLPYAHTGYCWAARRQFLSWSGGLIETAALGAGDHHMAWALIGHSDWTIPAGVTDGYRQPILQWQNRIRKHLDSHNIGYLPSSDIEHLWHGSKEQRGYRTRWSIIIDNQFDPVKDTFKNIYQVIELAQNKPKLVRQLDNYMRNRNEDGNLI